MNALIKAFHMTDWRELSLKRAYCPGCNTRRCFIKLDATEIAVRCLSCQASSITLSLIDVLNVVVGDISTKSVYELSARGSFVNYLRQVCGRLTCSEYFDGINPGAYQKDVVCQDVQQLTFKNKSFDVCTSLEVFEHVANDAAGFAEVCRVLRDDGVMIFTVPIDVTIDTIERAKINADGDVEHLMKPEYHTDPSRANVPILAFRTYGLDIVNKLVAAGFDRAEVRRSSLVNLWGGGRPVVVAYKSWSSGNYPQQDSGLIHHAARERAA